MNGLVAVLDASGHNAVRASELDELVDSYERVRGPQGGRRTLTAAGGTALAAELRLSTNASAPADPASTRASADGSWLASAGVLRALDGGEVHWPQGLDDLDGQFALVAFDAARGELTVATDALGMCAVYVAERGDRAYVSTSSLTLARHLRLPADRLAVQEFLLAGTQFGDGVIWQGVRRLQPATALRLRATAPGLRFETYWRPTLNEDIRRLPLERAVDACIEVCVETARQAYTDRPVWADLTGGYDSRLLALVLREAGVDARGNTRHTTEPREVPIARAVADRIGMGWEERPLPSDWPQQVSRMLPAALAWGDATLEVLQLARVLWVHQRLAESRPALLSAGGGEHLQYAAWKSELGRAQRRTKVSFDNFVNMRMLKPVERSVLSGSPRASVQSSLRRRLEEWVAPFQSWPVTAQLDMLYAYKSTGHFGAYRSSDDGFLFAHLPFYLRPVFETAISTDPKHRNNHVLMRAMIERLDRSVAALPTTRGGPAQPLRLSTAHRFLPYYAQVGRKAVTKISEKAVGRSLLLSQGSYGWAAQAHRSVLADLSGSGLFDAQKLRSGALYDASQLGRLLAAATEPAFRESALLGRIITVEMALSTADAEVA